MKNVILLACLVTLLNSCVPYQYQFTSIDEPIVKVYDQLPGDKSEIFIKANEWMIKTFNDATNIIQYSDKAEGVLIGKYQMHGELTTGAYSSADTRIFAIINIKIKDGKARLLIKPLSQWRYDASGFTIYNYSKEDALAEIEELSNSLQASLLEKDIEF